MQAGLYVNPEYPVWQRHAYGVNVIHRKQFLQGSHTVKRWLYIVARIA